MVSFIGSRRALIQPKRVVASVGSVFALDFKDSGKDFGAGGTTVDYGSFTYGTYNRIVLCISAKGASVLPAVSSVSLNGVNGAALSGASRTSGIDMVDIWILTPSGTSGTLTVTYSNSVASGSAVGIYGLNTTTTTPSVTGNDLNVFGTTVGGTYTVPSSGRSVIFASGNNNGVNFSWTSATSDIQRSDGNFVQNFARTTSTGSVSPVATASASDLLLLSFAAWGP